MNNPVVKILSLFMMIIGMFIMALMSRYLLGTVGMWHNPRGLEDLIAVNICIFLGLAFLTLLFMWVGRSWSTPPAGQSNQQVDDAIRELHRVQDRIEQRVTNLETILLSRVHDGVRHEKY